MSNQISVFLDPTTMPSQSQAQATFDQNMAAFFANLPVFGSQFNASIANYNASFSGNAYAIPYTIDLSSTTDADPGAGNLRLDNATQNLATTLRMDLLGAGGTIDYTSMIDTFDASTSTVKGQIRIVKQGDASKFLFFDVTARATPTGYRNISVTPRASSSANPFVNGDAVLLFFQRTGDKGNAGTQTYQLLSQATVSTPVASIDFLTVFSSTYDTYVIEIAGLLVSSATNLLVYLAKAGAVDTSGVYLSPVGDGAVQTAGNTSLLFPSSIPTSGMQAMTATLKVRNANSTTAQKAVSLQGSSNTLVVIREGSYAGANAVSGFRLAPSGGGNFTAGTIRIYGVTNA